jgi:hypothetical protein
MFILYLKGGSLGEQIYNTSKHGRIVKQFESKEEAKSTAKAYNKILSPGEKKYYGLKYHVKEIKPA